MTWDVIVVGGRAAGAATAMLLARGGARVVVLERSPYGADTLSTHALMRGGVVQLHRWGLLDRVVAAGTPPIRWTVFTYGGEHIAIPIKPSFGVDALYAPRRTVLDPILVDAACEAGAEVRHGIRVGTVCQDGRGRVTGVAGLDERGRPFELTARIVVGADGMRSTVARLVGATIDRVGIGASATVYGYWRGLETDGYEWIFRPGAAAGVIPTNEDQACVFASAPPARVGGGGLAVLHALLGEADAGLAARLAAATPPPGVRTFAGRPGFVRRSWGPGWALVGDAGYWKDPLTAHGLTDALRDAELLGAAIVSSLRGEQDETSALAGYQATRDGLSADLFAVTDTIAQHRWTDDEIGGLLMRLSDSMAEEVALLGGLEPLRVAEPVSGFRRR
jgi:2-polyprenyl-6-methoxyphenol hydroxylase-like FAD-dependent oxidoreductase